MVYPADKETFRVVVEDEVLFTTDQNNQGGCVERIQDTLGLNPQGGYADVVTRLNALLPKANIKLWQDTLQYTFNGNPEIKVVDTIDISSSTNFIFGNMTIKGRNSYNGANLVGVRMYINNPTSYDGFFNFQFSVLDEWGSFATSFSRINRALGSLDLGIQASTNSRNFLGDSIVWWVVAIEF